MTSNNAAWLPARGARLEVGSAPYTQPGDDEIVVRTRAVAVNPLDWMIQVAGRVLYPWISPPFVLGADLAGDVVEVGRDVTRFAVGDRVLALTVGTDKDSNSSARSAYQEHVVVLERLTAPIPETLSYEDAAVLPLGLGTAASALFQQDLLALAHPTSRPEQTGQTLLVWGGSTSVGSNAIQLGVAAGYEVVTTASPHNADHVRRLGACEVFDYTSPTVVQDLAAALSGRTVAGAIALGVGSAGPCADILARCTGRKFLAMASPSVSFADIGQGRRGSLQLLRKVVRLASSTLALLARCRPRGIRARFIWGTSLKDNEVSTLIFEDFLPQALAEGRYQAAPQPLVVGSGLDRIQTGLDTQRAGVSARKVVVTL